MNISFDRALADLEGYCRRHDWRGVDCYDALNSRLFRSTPLYRSRVARTLWTQAFKNSPVDLRPLGGVSREDNPKALALFLLGMVSRERRSADPGRRAEIRRLADRLVALRAGGSEPAGWGYPFDWQSRAFFAPRGTPNVVVTSFAGIALLAASNVLRERAWQEAAGEGCRFVAERLAIEDEDGSLFFAYVPGDRSLIYNATLLGARLLTEGGVALVEQRWVEMAERAARRVVNAQSPGGAWSYGPRLRHRWIDSFHTGYNLTALEAISRCLGTDEFDGAIARGYAFYRNRFFREDSAPRYYANRTYPIDIHSAAVAIVTFLSMRRVDPLGERWAAAVARWTVDHMRDPEEGYFHFQKRLFYTIRTPYMRWSQAWMYYALSLLTASTEQAGALELIAAASTVGRQGVEPHPDSWSRTS